MSLQSVLSIPSTWKTNLTYSLGTAGYGSWFNRETSRSHTVADAKFSEISNSNIITPFFMICIRLVCF